MNKIPTTIITGFLGSGKTTIIQNMLDDLSSKEKIAIIKNEVSDVGVDSLELSRSDIQITELPNGCICCTLVGAMNDALSDIIKNYSPDRIIIEASGLAKPGQIAIAMELIEDLYVDSVIVVIDALNYTTLKEIEKSWAAQSQTEFIDLYIVNKVDKVKEADLDIIKDDILGINPGARIIETKDANIPSSLVVSLNEHSIENPIEERHSTLRGFESFIIDDFTVSDLSKLTYQISNLPKSIYRVKGYFKDHENKTYILNGVAGKIKITLTDKKVRANKLVFIGQSIMKYEVFLQNFLKKS